VADSTFCVPAVTSRHTHASRHASRHTRQQAPAHKVHIGLHGWDNMHTHRSACQYTAGRRECTACRPPRKVPPIRARWRKGLVGPHMRSPAPITISDAVIEGGHRDWMTAHAERTHFRLRVWPETADHGERRIVRSPHKSLPTTLALPIGQHRRTFASLGEARPHSCKSVYFGLCAVYESVCHPR
jgi:hypothetical protein